MHTKVNGTSRQGYISRFDRVPLPKGFQQVLMKDFKWLEDNITAHSISPDLLPILRPECKDGAEVRRARHEGETLPDEYLVVKFNPQLNDGEFARAVSLMHQVRGKELPVTTDKLAGLQLKGYMLVKEPHAIQMMRRMMGGCIQTPGQNGVGSPS